MINKMAYKKSLQKIDKTKKRYIIYMSLFMKGK